MPTTNNFLGTYSDELQSFLDSLTSGEAVPLSSGDDPPWFEPGVNCEVDPEIYSHHFTSSRLRWMRRGYFATGDGNGPLRLFWGDGRASYGRELTDDEAAQFCELAGVELQS